MMTGWESDDTESRRPADDSWQREITALQWFSALPPGAEVRWEAGKDMSAERPWCSGSIDAGQPEVQELVGWGWVWSIWPAPAEPDDPTEPFSCGCPMTTGTAGRPTG